MLGRQTPHCILVASAAIGENSGTVGCGRSSAPPSVSDVNSMMRDQTILVLLAVAVAGAPAITLAQDTGRRVPSYCPDLQRLAGLATTKARFGSIAGNPREGNFRDATLALAGWTGCALYGATTYTCDSRTLDTA